MKSLAASDIARNSSEDYFDVGSFEDQIERIAAEIKAKHGADHDQHRDEAFIASLAELPPLTYQQQRLNAANVLGLRVTVLDKLVAAKRPPQPERPLFPWWEVEPSSQPVDAERLVTEIVGHIRSYVVMSDDAARIVALWIVMTWVHDQAAIHSPILLVTSPEPNSGKTTLLGVISFLVRRSLRTAGVTPAALYRAVEKWTPTVMVDEADTAFVENDDLRRVVNSGWTRGEGVLLCSGETNEPYVFPTFCPKALGMKGQKLPDTTLSRTIIIEMVRRKPNEQVMDFGYVDDDRLAELRSELARYAADNADLLRRAHPAPPQGFENRRAANLASPVGDRRHSRGGLGPEGSGCRREDCRHHRERLGRHGTPSRHQEGVRCKARRGLHPVAPDDRATDRGS